MTSRDDVERQLRWWMAAQPTDPDDARLLGAIADRTRGVGQHRGLRGPWSQRGLRPFVAGRHRPLLSVAPILAGLVIVGLVSGTLFLVASRGPSPAAPSSPSPSVAP